MSHEAYIIRSSRIVADNRIAPGSILIRGEKIERIQLASEDGQTPAAPIPGTYPELDASNLIVMPGLVDTHVHVNEPGRTDWEGFATAGRAAAAGGITTMVVMPLNCSPAATNVAVLMGEAEAAAGKCLVDYGFWGGLVPGNIDELEPMWNAGALGFKAFMVESGVDDFAGVSNTDLFQASETLARIGAPLLVHAEDPGTLATFRKKCDLDSNPRSYAEYVRSRHELSEMVAVRLIWMHAGEHRGWPVHIVHVTCQAAADFLHPTVRDQRAMTGETCPHYLTFASEDIPDGATQFKCAPPIRDRATREALWQALRDGTLTMVVSDHSPCPPELKLLDTGDFARAWGGISSLQLGLSVTWTGASQRNFHLTDIASWMCDNPAKLAGINHRKGTIAPGRDADIIFFDPDESWTVRAAALHHRHKLTPYDGMPIRGVVKRTILRGRTIYDSALANPFPLDPIGQWLKRGTT